MASHRRDGAHDSRGRLVRAGLVADITERKEAEEAVRRQNATLEGVNKVLEVCLTCQTEKDLGIACLGIAQTLTQSTFGFIGEINEQRLQEIAISNPGWDACAIIDAEGHRASVGGFEIHGIYGRVLSDGKPLFTNDPANHPDRIGLPAGHTPLESFLGVPLIREGRTIGMIGVANRPGGFARADQDTLEALAPAIVEALIRKRAEEALRSALEETRRSNEDLQQFAHVASHDLQEPLRMVTAFLNLIKERYAAQLDDKAREYIGYSVDGATRMSNLIRDVLEYSRVDRQRGHGEPVDARQAVAEALATLQGLVEDTGATVTLDELPTVKADPVRLAQVFVNLISNAIKFRHPDRPCQVRVAAARQDGNWVFSVRDNGIGIAPEFHERVFVIFQRLHSVGKYPGTGIGLALCRRIVERHGGRIWVESAPGTGSTFYFTLPETRAK